MTCLYKLRGYSHTLCGRPNAHLYLTEETADFLILCDSHDFEITKNLELTLWHEPDVCGCIRSLDEHH